MRRVTGKGLAAALLLLCMVAMAAVACAQVDQSRSCTLTVRFGELDGETIAQAPRMNLALYRVAEVAQEGDALTYTAVPAFAGSGVALGGTPSATKEQERAQALADYAQAEGLTPDHTARSGADGSTRFEGLPVGLYLLTSSPVEADVLSAPVLVSLPTMNADGSLDYLPTAQPKLETMHGALLIEKKAESGTVLPGAAFLLEREVGGTFQTFAPQLVTDQNGQIAVENLPFGTYRITEIVAPAGFILDTVPRIFEVTGSGVLTLTVSGYTAGEGAVTQLFINYPVPTPSPTPVPTPAPGDDLVNIRVTKRWADGTDADGIRPASITLYLQRRKAGQTNYATILTVDVDGTGNRWYYSFLRLPARAADGTAYEYRVREAAVEGYTTAYDDTAYVITNRHAPEPTPTPDATATPEPTATPVPTPSPTPLPNVTPTATPRRAAGVVYVDGEYIFIDDEGVPLGLLPQTGDDDDLIALLCGSAVLLAAGFTLLVIYLRRRKHAHA